MITLDEFFRLQYKSMCGYIGSFRHKYEDVEEVVSDVIYAHFETVQKKLIDSDKFSIRLIRRYLVRRALWDLVRRYQLNKHAKNLSTDYASEGGESVQKEYGSNNDTPEEILSIKQRLPIIPQILIDYEPHKGSASEDGSNGQKIRAAANNAKKLFMKRLATA